MSNPEHELYATTTVIVEEDTNNNFNAQKINSSDNNKNNEGNNNIDDDVATMMSRFFVKDFEDYKKKQGKPVCAHWSKGTCQLGSMCRSVHLSPREIFGDGGRAYNNNNNFRKIGSPPNAPDKLVQAAFVSGLHCVPFIRSMPCTKNCVRPPNLFELIKNNCTLQQYLASNPQQQQQQLSTTSFCQLHHVISPALRSAGARYLKGELSLDSKYTHAMTIVKKMVQFGLITEDDAQRKVEVIRRARGFEESWRGAARFNAPTNYLTSEEEAALDTTNINGPNAKRRPRSPPIQYQQQQQQQQQSNTSLLPIPYVPPPPGGQQQQQQIGQFPNTTRTPMMNSCDHNNNNFMNNNNNNINNTNHNAASSSLSSLPIKDSGGNNNNNSALCLLIPPPLKIDPLTGRAVFRPSHFNPLRHPPPALQLKTLEEEEMEWI